MDLSKLKQILDSGGSAEDLLGEMRNQGCSKIGSIKLLVKVQGLSLKEAKQIVHESRTWQDRRESDDQFQENLMAQTDRVPREGI